MTPWMKRLLKKQPPPKRVDRAAVVPELIRYGGMSEATRDSLVSRAAVGLATYGDFLREGNGRDALADEYQEVVDGLQYAFQSFMEDPSIFSEKRVRRLANLAEDIESEARRQFENTRYTTIVVTAREVFHYGADGRCLLRGFYTDAGFVLEWCHPAYDYEGA